MRKTGSITPRACARRAFRNDLVRRRAARHLGHMWSDALACRLRPALAERMSEDVTTAMRFGLVGYGAFGRLHAQSISRIEEATLAAICARSDEAAAAAASDFPGVTVHRDYRTLVQDASVDVVDVV